MAGLIEDVKWVAVTKHGKSLRRLVAELCRVMIIAVCLAIPMVLVSSESSCQTQLDLRQYDISSETLAGFDSQNWCKQFQHHGRQDRIGHPCVCTAIVDPTHVCNARLDPQFYISHHDGWCAAFDHGVDHWYDPNQLGGSKFFQPCECVSALMQFAPDWPLFLFLVMICCVICWPFTIGIWIWYTPIWAELGVTGVNVRKKNHFARVRISPKHLYEMTYDESSAPELVDMLQKAVDEAGGSDLLAVRIDELESAEFLVGRFFDLCLDEDGSGTMEFDEMQSSLQLMCSADDQGKEMWVRQAHEQVVDALTTDEHVSLRRTTTENLFSDYDNLLENVTAELDQELVASRNIVGNDALVGFGTIVTALRACENLKHFGADSEVEKCVVRELQIKELIRRKRDILGAQSNETNAAETTFINPMSQNEDDEAESEIKPPVSARDKNELQEIDAEIDKLRAEVEKLRNSTVITRDDYVRLFLAASRDRLSKVSSHRTRAKFPMSVLQRKTVRPLKHELLRRWQFRPLLPYLLTKREEQLLIFDDYVTLCVSEGTPVCCCCCTIAADYCNYTMLLKDVYFIETGMETPPVLHQTLMFGSVLLLTVLALMVLVYIVNGYEGGQTHGKVNNFFTVPVHPAVLFLPREWDDLELNSPVLYCCDRSCMI